MTNLKPCPFCGGEAMESGPNDVHCSSTSCWAFAKTRHVTREQWNTRPAPVPRVKPLEWLDTGSYGLPETTKTLVGIYRINEAWSGGYSCVLGMAKVIPNGDTGMTNFPTIEEAQTAAFADHERRILSALDMEKDE